MNELVTANLLTDELWSALEVEIQKVKEKIENNTLVPEDTKEVRALAKQVTTHVADYRRAITAKANEYKSMAEQRLSDLGYNVIEEYIEKKKKEHQVEIDKRKDDKLTKLKEIITTALDKNENVKNSAMSGSVLHLLVNRFPHINSGAISKTVNWTVVESIVYHNIDILNQQLNKTPIIKNLPLNSNTIALLSNYLKTGDLGLFQEIPNTLKADEHIIKNILYKQKLTDETVCVNAIKSIIDNTNIDDRTKIQQVTNLISIWNNK